MATVGCSKRTPPTGGAASASASASPTIAEVSGDIEPTLVAALESLPSCEAHKPEVARGPDGKVDVDTLTGGLFCPADVELSKTLSSLEAKDDYLRTESAKLRRTCARSLEHASMWVRRAAYRCVAKHAPPASDAPPMIAQTIASLDKETDADVRRAQWMLLGALDVAVSDQITRAVALAKKHTSDAEELEAALEALVPRSDYSAAAPEALAFAKEQAKEGRAGEAVLKLVAYSAASPSEACELYTDLAASNGADWAAGIEGAARTLGGCKEQSGRFVAAVVARVEQAKMTPSAWTKRAVQALYGGLALLALSPADKAKLRAAFGALSPEQRQGYSGADLIAKLDKELR